MISKLVNHTVDGNNRAKQFDKFYKYEGVKKEDG